MQQHCERIDFRPTYADPGMAQLLILKISEHPTKLWRPYTAPSWKCDLSKECNESGTELGQGERRRANVQLERIEDGPGAHLQPAEKRNSSGQGKERNQRNESAD